MYNLSFFPSYFRLKNREFFSFIWVCIFLPGFLLLFLPHSLAQQNGEAISQSRHINTILIASEPDYPPYCIVDKNGNPDGFSVELFKAAADAVGLNVEIKIGIWNQIKNDLAEGRIDALPLVGRTPEREEVFDFTMPYLSLRGAVFVRKNTTDIESIENLKNKEIAVMKGDNAEEFVRREKISEKIFTTNTLGEAFRELEAGRVDALITQRITGLKLLEEMNIKSVKALDFQLPEFRQDFCFAVQKGNHELLVLLNEGLSVVIANGKFEQIRSNWFGPVEREFVSRVKIIRTTLFILIPVLIAGIILWIVFLRTEVKRRTKKLNNEVNQHKKTLQALEIQQKLYKESEAQIRLLLNSTAEGIYRIDISGNCTLINKSALQILGFKNDKKVIGINIHELIHHTRIDGTPYPAEDCNIFKALNLGEGTHSADDVLWRTDSASFPVEYFSYPIRQNGEVTGAVVTFWDISERKKGESELLQLKNELEIKVEERTAELQEKVGKLDKSQKAMLYMVEDLNTITSELKNERRKLEAVNQELEAFTYSVSHDLRAPLRAINGFSKFLMEDYAEKLDGEGKRFINTISESASKMDKLITDLLNLSRVSRSSLNYSKVDMKATAISMFHEIASAEEQSTFDFIVNEMPVIEVDLNLIKQVWQNLIGNALKYSSKSEIKKIEIGATKNNTEISFYIKDEGAGFNNNYKHKLFGVFQRLHHENEFEGTGVGLAIVQRILQRHGGKVWAEGEINKGATFYFTLLSNNTAYF
jgi:PAS domain S-box-containing protein